VIKRVCLPGEEKDQSRRSGVALWFNASGIAALNFPTLSYSAIGASAVSAAQVTATGFR